MEAHPGAAVLHVGLKRGAFVGCFRTGIEKNHYLILMEKRCVQIPPIGCGVEAEIVSCRHGRKPLLSFTNKADVCLIIFRGRERNDSEGWLATVAAERCAATDERCNAQCFHGSPRFQHGTSEVTDFDTRVKLAIYHSTAESGRSPGIETVARHVGAAAQEIRQAYARLANNRLLVLES